MFNVYMIYDYDVHVHCMLVPKVKQLTCTNAEQQILTFYRYIFWFVVDCCISNAFILMKEHQPAALPGDRKAFKSFRLQLAQGLIGAYNSRKRYSLPVAVHEVATRRSSAPAARRGEEAAQYSHLPFRGTKGRCSYCWLVKKRRHESSTRCRTCQRALCLDSRDEGEASCYERWHVEGYS